MAYGTTTPTSLKKSSSRPSASTARPATGYASALSGFSTQISQVRTQLLSDAISAINYQIEVGTATPEQKVSLYQSYLENLTPGTKEYYDTQTKIQNLKDSVSSGDFALAKALYANNQMTVNDFHSILKQRVAEGDLSASEKQARTIELWNFEKSAKNSATDKALQESTLKQNEGVITAAQNYQNMLDAYNKETDPDRKRALQIQLQAQGEKVVNENLANRELTIKSGIKAGVASTSDLMSIAVQRYQLARTETERLSAYNQIQDLEKTIADEQVASMKKMSSNAKGATTDLINQYDKKIAQAKASGDVTGMYLLTGQKTQALQDFYSNPSISNEDKGNTDKWLNWMKSDLGVDYDPTTGESTIVPATSDISFEKLTQYTNDPSSTLLIRKTDNNGSSSVDLLLGQKTEGADGQMFYDFGKNALPTSLVGNSLQASFEMNNTAVGTDNGTVNQLMASGRQIQKLPAGYDEALKSQGLKSLTSNQFSGEYVVLGKDGNGQDIRGYLLTGKEFANVQGSTPLSSITGTNVAGRADTYVWTPPTTVDQKTGQVLTNSSTLPNQDTINSFKLVDPNIVNNPITRIASGLQSIVPNMLNTPIGNFNQTASMQNTVQNTGSLPTNTSLDLKLPDFNKIISDVTSKTSNLETQLISSLFSKVNKPYTSSMSFTPPSDSYVTSIKNSVNSSLSTAFKSATGFGMLSTVYNAAKSVLPKVKSFLGIK